MGFFNNFFGRHNSANQVPLNEPKNTSVNQILSTPNNPYDFLDSFNKNNWSNLSYQDKMNSYQALEHQMAKEQGRAERQIIFEDFSKTMPGNGNVVGYYSPNDDKLHMDIGYLNGTKNPYDGIDTVIHEGRHAYQADTMNGFAAPDSKISPNLQGMKENEIPGNYHSGDKFYFLQPSEYDAHTYASEVMNRPEFKEHFINEPSYGKFCEAREAYVDNLSEDLKNDTDYRREALAQKAENAENYRNGVLSNPNSPPGQIRYAKENSEKAQNELNNFINENYTNGKFDIEKSGNSLSHNDALAKGYSKEELASLKFEPTYAQKETNDSYRADPNKEVKPSCIDSDMNRHLDECSGPVPDSVYMKKAGQEQSQNEPSPEDVPENSQENENGESDGKEENPGNEPEDGENNSDERQNETSPEDSSENTQENENGETDGEEEASENEPGDGENGSDEQQDGDSPEDSSENTQENENGETDGEEEASENEPGDGENGSDEQQEAGSEPEEDGEESLGGNDDRQEAGSEPEDDSEESLGGNDEQQEAGSEPEENGEESYGGNDDRQEAGSEPEEDSEESLGGNDDRQEAGSEPEENSGESNGADGDYRDSGSSIGNDSGGADSGSSIGSDSGGMDSGSDGMSM